MHVCCPELKEAWDDGLTSRHRPCLSSCHHLLDCLSPFCLAACDDPHIQCLPQSKGVTPCMSSLPSRREQGGLGLEARHAAARLWLQLGCLHMKEQPAAADSDTPAASVQPGKTVHCLQQAALKCQAFGEQLGNRSWAMKLNARAQLSLCVCVCVCVCMCVCVCVCHALGMVNRHRAWASQVKLVPTGHKTHSQTPSISALLWRSLHVTCPASL